jgi:phospholipid/cholesterol/gamma-HCH transport system substrate-binding protein
MITRRTKIQLIVFALITVIGVTYVGARYARLDRLFFDRSYTVTAHFADSGGIFAGGEVTYRGVRIGTVKELDLTKDKSGVDVVLDIDNKWDKIPADTLAVVGNRSAVGEQYVELQPQADDGPYLENGSQIAMDDTETPISTQKLLGDISETVSSVNRNALRTTVKELGTAFAGTGEDLQRIIDTGNSFIRTANDNFDVTTALIRDSNVVLRGQVGSESALRAFASHLSSFSDALAGADSDLRHVIDSGSFTANQLRTFLAENQEPLGNLLTDVTSTGQVVVDHLPGLKLVLVAYPLLLEGSYGVIDNTAASDGLYDAHIGLILTTTPPCYAGYVSAHRAPQQREDLPLPTDDHCTEPPTKGNPRGAQNAPQQRPAPGPAVSSAPVYVSFDPRTGKIDWEPRPSRLAGAGSVAPASLGEDSWKWLYLNPLLAGQ